MSESEESPSPRDRASEILSRSDPGGAEDPVGEVFPFVYEELRAMARRQLAGEWGQATLNTTAVVHEAYLRLVDETRVARKGRSYFFAAASRAMRRVLVDAARRRTADKRGGEARPVTLKDDQVAVDGLALEVLAVDQALEVLAADSPRMAAVVEHRFFTGLSYAEIADLLDVSERTVKYDWAMARAWLRRALDGRPGNEG